MQLDLSNYFVELKDNPEFFNCLLCAEKNTHTPSKSLSGKKKWNLKKHIECVHPDIYDKYFNEKNRKAMMKKRLKTLQCFCKIVTINGRPFASLLDSGFIELIEDDLKQLDLCGLGITVDKNFLELKKYIDQLVKKVQSRIQQDFKDRYISLMLDAASKNNKSVLGISAQYRADGKLNSYVLGMIYMEKAHTAEYMNNLVKNCLKKYEIQADHAISFTTDNASAMIAMTKQFDEDIHEVHRFDDDDDSETIDLGLPSFINGEQLSEEQMKLIMESISSIEEIRESLDDADDFEQLYEEFIGDITKASSMVHTIRCAAHVNQLGVRCGIKKSNVGPLLAMCNFITKKMRTEKYRSTARDANIDYKIPHLGCPTRWDSDYDMVRIGVYSISIILNRYNMEF